MNFAAMQVAQLDRKNIEGQTHALNVHPSCVPLPRPHQKKENLVVGCVNCVCMCILILSVLPSPSSPECCRPKSVSVF
jgi:hypothetical protein